jgi:phosphoribosylformimino-5-aminoimidazole carboxamide ribotide isomerase
MEVIPAVDIRGGRCVRLYKGRYDQETVYHDRPEAMAAQWEAEGASFLHLVDLDGAREGRPVNREAIQAIARQVAIPFEIGGGIRDLAAVEEYLSLGAARVILGTAAVESPDLLADACRSFPGQVALSLDAKDGLVATSGWLETRPVKAVQMASELAEHGPAVIIYTDINRDGTHGGVNLEATAELCRAVEVPVIAAGGISTLEHIKELLPLEELGLAGVISGKALYDRTLDLQTALKVARAKS